MRLGFGILRHPWLRIHAMPGQSVLDCLVELRGYICLTSISTRVNEQGILMATIIIPLPEYGFDPSEAAIPWRLLTENRFEVVFATPNGRVAAADSVMVSGTGLGLLKPLLRARRDARHAYQQMIDSAEFNAPISYEKITTSRLDGLLLPGGHDKAIRPYLESSLLQSVVVDCFKQQKIVAAICHGVVLVARSINAETGLSVLADYNTTALLKSQELTAYTLTRLWLGDYYLTYPEITVEGEVTEALARPQQFICGPLPLFKDQQHKLAAGFVVRDRHYLSARWPGDIYTFSHAFIEMIRQEPFDSKI